MEDQEDREGEVFEPVLRQVYVESEFVMQGPMTAWVNQIRIGGQVVTPSSPATIAVGDYFDVELDIEGDNPGMGFLDVWSICATMITTTGLLPNYDILISLPNQGSISATMKLDENGQPGPMPNSDITLRLRLFGYQGRNTSPPARSLW